MVTKIMAIAIFSFFFNSVESCSNLDKTNQEIVDIEETQEDETINLNLGHLSYRQKIDSDKDGKGSEFIKIQVVDVTNPKLHSIAVEVFHLENGTENILGSFALYPSDNIGNFLIATQGKLNPGGTVLLKLVVPEITKQSDSVNITLKKVSFL